MLYEAIKPHNNSIASICKNIRAETNSDTETTKISTIVSQMNGSHGKIQTENKKPEIQNGNGQATNGTKKHSDSSDSDSEKETSNNKNIPNNISFNTSQNFSSNVNLDINKSTLSAKKNGVEEKIDHRSSPNSDKNGHQDSNSVNNTSKKHDSDNFTKRWENKYINDKNSFKNDLNKNWENKYVNDGLKNNDKVVNDLKNKNGSSDNSPNLTKLVPYEVNDSSSSSSSEDSPPDVTENTVLTKASAGKYNFL